MSKQLRPIPLCPTIVDGELSRAEAEKLATLFRALADPARVRLLSLIAAQPGAEACACHFTEQMGLSQPTGDDPQDLPGIHVDGKIVHVQRCDGGVKAHGIQLHYPAERIDEEMAFIEFLQSFDRARRLATVSGDIGESGVSSTLEMFVSTAPRGTLVVHGEEAQSTARRLPDHASVSEVAPGNTPGSGKNRHGGRAGLYRQPVFDAIHGQGD